MTGEKLAIKKDVAKIEDTTLSKPTQLEVKNAAKLLQTFLTDIKDPGKHICIPTGFSNLDNLLDGGLYAGLYVLGAISSLGKTTFCLQIADQIAQAGHDVLLFSLEMGSDELIAKSISRLTFVSDMEQHQKSKHAKPTRGILSGARYAKYNRTEQDLIESSVASYGQYADHIYIIEGIGNVGVKEIRDIVQRHVQQNGKAPVVVIDYLQIIAPADYRGTDKQNTDKNVLELKRMSRDYNIPIIGISSFNRENYSAPVNLSSFKESGAIEYSSDVLLGLQYDGMEYKKEDSDSNRETRIRKLREENLEKAKKGLSQKIQVVVLKNRNGSKGNICLNFYPMFNFFTEDEQALNHITPEDKGEWVDSNRPF